VQPEETVPLPWFRQEELNNDFQQMFPGMLFWFGGMAVVRGKRICA
jgi:hypothetical protein